MKWMNRLEEALLPPMFQAASEVCDRVRHVELDLVNQNVLVVPVERQNSESRRRIEQAIDATGRRILPTVTDWPVWVPPPPQYTFTTHLYTGPRLHRPFGQPEHLFVFDIEMQELLGLREGESTLAEMAREHKYVATFALGGASALARLSMAEWDEAMPANPFEAPAVLDQFAKRFHLLPGLGWSNTDAEERQFISWLAGLEVGTSLFMFDTGSKGNGPRAAANAIRNAAATGQPIGPARIRIVGLVDDRDPAQERVEEDHDTPVGRTRLTVEYIHVPRLLSEDCQVLLGHERNRKLGYILPLRNAAIFRVFDDTGHRISVVASSGASDVFRALMTNAPAAPAVTSEPLTDARERAMVKYIHDYTRRGELNDLQVAFEWGLLIREQYENEYRGTLARYQASLKNYPNRKWDFAKKLVI
ncbi:MAG: hypothetical protein GXY83_16720 [Rhodopirellula sp.]|nr:hypothetical protein [Rhodopirellula sp.]